MTVMLLLVAILLLSCEAFKDRTQVKKASGPDVVEATIAIIHEKCVFKDDAQMLRRWAKAVSDDGQASKTFKAGFYGGIWQITENQYFDTKNANSTLLTSIKSEYGVDWTNTTWNDLQKPLYSALAARLSITTVLKDLESQAYVWGYFTGLPASSYIEAANSITTNCSISVDLLFVFDGSLGVGEDNLLKMETFMMNLIYKLDVASDKTRIAYEVLSTYGSSAILFDQFNSPEELERALDLIAWPSSGFHYGNFFVVRSMFSQGTRDWAPDISIFITNGKSNNLAETLRSAEMYLRTGVRSFAIGVGSEANLEELSAIASDGDCNHLILLETFDQLDFAASWIESRICKTIVQYETLEDFTISPSNFSQINTYESENSSLQTIMSSDNIFVPNFEFINITKPPVSESDNVTYSFASEKTSTYEASLEIKNGTLPPTFKTESTNQYFFDEPKNITHPTSFELNNYTQNSL